MMPFSDKADLKTAIETWLARQGDTEISGNADDLITLASDRLNRDMPLNAMRTDTTLTGSAGSRSIALPTDFYEPIALFLTTFGVYTQLTPFIAGNIELSVGNGVPQGWSINGTNIDLDRPCDQAHTFSFRYRQSFALSADGDTNWLLTNHPSVYLQAALIEAKILMQEWQGVQAYNALLQSAIESVLYKDSRNLSIAPLLADPALRSNIPFNILTG